MRDKGNMAEYNHLKIEGEIHQKWKAERVAEKIVDTDWKRKKFYLLDGPPYVNGVPHVGHAKTTVFKDIWGKFKFMQGFGVWFQPGFDCGGLPIENKVEEKLGIRSKTEIETKVGVDRFIEECKSFAKGNEPVWLDFYKKIGAWRGWMEPYLTSENYYLESGWWTVKQWHDKGLFSEGLRPGFWCPRCETVLAGIEVTESYKNLEDPSIFVKFPIEDKKNKGKEFLLVWTTTPWTLPANVAVVAHPDETYVKADVNGEKLILAEKLLPEIENKGFSCKILEKFSGKKLDGIKYKPVLDLPVQKEISDSPKAHTVLLSIPVMKRRVASKTQVKSEIGESDEFGHMVTMEAGTGLVHTAPGHGDADSRVGKHYGLPEPSPVDEKGRFTEEAGDLAGIFVKKADPLIIEKLRKNNLLLYSGKITHSYPLCWRCKTPLIYRMSRQWFLKMDLLKEKIIDANKKLRWLPEFAREQYNNLISEAPDWAVTRQRYWGIPLPIWKCGRCNSMKVIGSREELRKNSVEKIPENFDLHKNLVDRVKLKCTNKGCEGKMAREKDIMDVWFDSGIAPWASLGYPFRNKELFEKLWPVDLVNEGQDQVRAWFNTLMVCGFATFGREPYRTVCLNGWTLDEKGEKMSKSLGNVILAEDACRQLGADVMRLYICHDVAPWETQKFSFRQAGDLKRFMNVLWNTYNFAETYAAKEEYAEKAELKIEDKWIISKINSINKSATNHIENFEFHLAARELVDFLLNDLSRWYIKIIRDRLAPTYWKEDKKAASFALRYVLERYSVLLSVFSPFISDAIYSKLRGKGSVHLEEWPKPEESRIGKGLEDHMEKAKVVVEAINAARSEKKVKLRWPVEYVRIKFKDKEDIKSIDSVKDVIALLSNSKSIEMSDRLKEPFEFSLGKLEIGKVLMDKAVIREIIRHVQELRKKAGMNVHEKIELFIKSDPESEKLAEKNRQELLSGVNASKINIGQVPEKHKKERLEVEGKVFEIGFVNTNQN
ncbi:MAG: isoleucine--tRNA ligase [Candidatus Aenigmarchaeota archaeon]|nr:isoleucine--tRNA ligase [Candidatus Aenigmarchaeota archaeon]